MKIITTLCTLALAMGGLLSAQLPERLTIKFPTAVVINGATIPAGDATIDVIRASGALMLAIHSESGENANVLVNRLTNLPSENQPRVILDHKGDTYFFNRLLLTDHTALQVLDAE